jgi:quercetin dioxygenase-like cupin family protein
VRAGGRAFVVAFAALLTGSAAYGAYETMPDALVAGWEGEPVCELQHQTQTHRVLRCTFPPGIGHERHFHPAHFGYALSGGTMQLTSANGVREAEISTGSSYSSDGVDWHEVVNNGETTVTYLIIEEL